MSPSVAASRAVGKQHETHYERDNPVRSVVRLAIAAATTLALTVPLTGAAFADPDSPVPSQREVDRAKKAVADKERGIKGLQASLDATNARLQVAVEHAGYMAEQYNGAMWRLSEAHEAARAAEAAKLQAVAAVETQGRGIITLVTESYQNGTELNSATAVMCQWLWAGWKTNWLTASSSITVPAAFSIS